MPAQRDDWISEMQNVEPAPADVIVYKDPEIRQMINTVSERLDVTTSRISACESVLCTTVNNDRMQSLEQRIESLEHIVWKLEDYIENWLDI